jgi:hypothetical protein
MKPLAVAVGLAATVFASAATAAPAFSLAGGYTGAIGIKFRNFENVDPALAPGSENYGVLRITSIETPGGDPLWQQGVGGNGFLTGVFADINVLTSVPDGAGGLNVQGSGGLMNIYLSITAPDLSQGLAGYAAAGGGCAPGDLCYNTISNNADTILFLQLAFVSGIDSTNPAVTVNANFDTTAFPTTGDAASYLDVIGGAYASNFDSNGQVTAFGNRDFLIQNTFCANNAPNCSGLGDWDLRSDDPATGRFIPEPGTLALLGLGLLGLGGVVRRKA